MPVNRERKTVWREKEFLDLEYTSLERLRNMINSAISAYSEEAVVHKTSIPYSDSDYYAIFVEEPETDEEMARRIETEEKYEKNREYYERQQYEALKAKFETK